MIKTGDLSRGEARDLIQSCFLDLADEIENYGGFVPATCDLDLEVLEQRELSLERIDELKSELKAGEFDGCVRQRAIELLSSRSANFSQLPTGRQIDLLSGVARALVEQQRLFLHRIEDRLSPYNPVDPLFSNCPTADLLPAGAGQKPMVPAAKGPTVGEAIASYLTAREKEWVRKTFLARQWQLRYLQEHLGEDTPLASVTSHDVRAFRDGILALRANHGRTPSQSFVEKQTDNAKKRIAPKTAALIFEPAKAFLRWCEESEGMIPSNPAKGVRLSLNKKPNGVKSRRSFRTEELEQLFSAPVFTGCQSVHRRFVPGPKVIWDAKFWIPVLAYYTGARLGELVQLHISDVRLDGEIPLITINDDNGGASAWERKHVKSAAAVRLIPLHPDVLELGFGEFVGSRHKMKKKSVRLFPEIPFGSDGQASTVFSKWFARFLDQTNLTDRAIVFHSFRHDAEDAFRNANQHQYVIDRIIGHADGATSALYGDGVDLETAYAAVKAMKLKVRLPALFAGLTQL